MTNDTSSTSIHLNPGAMLLSYRIERILGAGGFGVTYLATDTSTEHQVVIKENFPRAFAVRDTVSGTIHPLSDNTKDNFLKTQKNFLEESRKLASIHHPNIVEILNVFEANGTAYFTMPYLGANNLQRYGFKEHGKRIPEKQCRILLKGILDALTCLHSQNILHRDIKPANILITDSGVPVLIDFGCMRSMDMPQTTAAQATEDFVAPELMLGLTNKLGPWTDLYSLGASIYYLLTGTMPQRGDTRLFNDTLVPLASIEDLTREYSRAFLATIDKAMAPDLSTRYQSAEAWGMDIEHPEHAQRVSAAPKKPASSATKSPRPAHPSSRQKSRKKGSGARALTGLILLAALIGGGWYAYDNGMIPLLDRMLQSKEAAGKTSGTSTAPPTGEIVKATPRPADTVSKVPSGPSVAKNTQAVSPVPSQDNATEQQEIKADSVPQIEHVKKPIPPVPALDIRKSRLPSAFLSKIASGDYAGLQKAVLDGIKAMSDKSDDPMADPRYSHLLSVAELINATTPSELIKYHRSSPQAQAFMKEFLNDPEWLELYLGAGLIPEKTTKGLEVLEEIWKFDGKSPDFRTYLPLATGIANIWSVGPTAENMERNDDVCNPLNRYKFFKTYHKQGRLHPDFLKLRPWEIRFVAGHPWDDESYEWAMQNVNIPWRRYTDACWFADYTGTNTFGDTIQGPLFYAPWRDMYGQAENTKLHGGVCGGLSTFGSLCAAAHGMPTYTVGQPGHCAYAVRAKRNDWQGGFGGPDGGMHNHIFGSQAPTSYMLMETVFGDDKTIDHAYRYARQASALQQAGDKDKALEAIDKAISYSPVQPVFRQLQQKQLIEKGGMTPQDWLEYAEEALPYYEGNGYAALEALRPAEEQFIAAIPEQDRLKWYRGVHDILAGTRTSWAVKIDSILDSQLANIDSDQGREQFLEAVFSRHLNAKDTTNFGQVLEWAVKTFVNGQQDALFNKAFTVAAASAAQSKSAQDEKSTKSLKEAYSKAIFAAEQAHSIPAFQALTKAALMLTPPKAEERTYKSEPLPGKLVPPSGMIRVSSTSGWDRPWEHMDMLKPCGGFNHTDKESQPYVIAELPNTVNLSGVIVSKADGSQDRIKKAKVSTSVDGATWFPMGETDNMQSEWRLEAPAEGRKAKWIRFEAINDTEPNFLHLKHFLIFAK
ncbi:protein kinase [Akkermansia sp. N21169]|uniref:serine/threonine protein kinase n=1 Tax=Akkermansia sp. N21169 TaxID=3040765 RepID=UPI00244E806C|nr:protein kinase [Akkermansia sp. N21169]MDH3069603.1 protein kinase [Akkermansia sp. N21169]